MARGTIIFLNGTSSAGKTTLAHALQEQLREPYLHIALDQFRDGMPPRFRGLNAPSGSEGERGLNVVPVRDGASAYTEVRFGEMGRRMLRGMRRAIAAMADEGNNVIIDDIILEPDFLEDYLRALVDHRVYFVGVMCPPEVINEREKVRPGRFPGTAVGHFAVCHAHDTYDVAVDTSKLMPDACARRVKTFMEREQPTAFRELFGKLVSAGGSSQ